MIPLSKDAQARLNGIPFLIRVFVQRRLQAAAKKRGLEVIDVKLIEERGAVPEASRRLTALQF